MKIKLLLVLTIALTVYSCSKDNDEGVSSFNFQVEIQNGRVVQRRGNVFSGSVYDVMIVKDVCVHFFQEAYWDDGWKVLNPDDDLIRELQELGSEIEEYATCTAFDSYLTCHETL